MENEIDYEKISYGKIGYKRIQSLRRKGERRNIDVPKLNYELTKPEKPRIAFWIAAIVGIILFAGILVGAGFLIKFLIDFFSDFFKDSGGYFKTLLNPSLLFASQGLSIVPVMFLILAYMFLILIVALPIMVAIYCYRFGRNMLYLARCSKEEFAKGEVVIRHIMNYSGILIGTIIIFVLGLMMIKNSNAKLLTGLICGGIVLIFGGLLALIIFEKKKCGKWFKDLDEDKKQNYLAHEKALSSVKSRLGFEKRFWDNLFN